MEERGRCRLFEHHELAPVRLLPVVGQRPGIRSATTRPAPLPGHQVRLQPPGEVGQCVHQSENPPGMLITVRWVASSTIEVVVSVKPGFAE